VEHVDLAAGCAVTAFLTDESITSDRSYPPRMDQRSALEELRRHSGTQFDPTVVDAFCEELEATKALRDSPVAEAA
jgi:response regulator RpfG family c-di-GMP phosphodiesterase